MTTKTILLDLDNTLLGNDMDTFLPAYFGALQKRLGHLLPNHHLPAMMHAAVKQLQSRQEAQATNYDTFMAEFSRRVGHSIEAIQGLLDQFYTTDYPALQHYTEPRPEAPVIVDYLLNQGCRVVVATNPLFPAVAIAQRLEWAGVGQFPYTWVTHMENSHFAKPNPHYYQEILTTTGSLPQHTWMVGDDPLNDIAPARALGLKTWWIVPAVAAPDQVLCDQQGSLADFLAWITAENTKL